MFRFSIRDVLLVTLIVAMGLGWWVDRRQLQAELARASYRTEQEAQRANKWRGGALALEHTLEEAGVKVTWGLKASEVTVFPTYSGTKAVYNLDFNWPCTEED